MSPSAERYWAMMEADEQRAREATALSCTAERCEYPDKIGVRLGEDVSIDGDVWAGSLYAGHIATCPWHNPKSADYGREDER